MEVLSALRPGLDERIFERALVIELRSRGLAFSQQKQFPVKYKGKDIGALMPDLIVEDRIIVDAKVVFSFNKNHIAQMLGFLAIANLEIALLLSFKEARLKWKRVIKGEIG